MAYLMQDVVNQSRGYLSDDLQQRFSDADLLRFANNGTLILRLKRPDMFVGQFLALPGDKLLADAIPFPEENLPAVAQYAAALVESGNNEAVLRQRASMFFQLFNSDIKG